MCGNIICLYVCKYISYVCNAHRDQKRVLDPWNWSLQMVMSSHVGTGIKTVVSGRSQCASPLNPLSKPMFFLIFFFKFGTYI